MVEHRAHSNVTPLCMKELYANKRLVVIGGTGFLGKVWWSLLLDRVPGIGRIYLVVRPKPGVSSSERFWKEIAPHPCLEPLRRHHGEQYDAFLRDKVVPVDGDITQPFCGLHEPLRQELRGQIDAVVNASGIVNFQPPLDVALEVNAFGAQTVVDLARDLGNVAVLHTSTCYVAGYQPGIVEETNPLDHPFPFAGKLERAHWDADREIAECLDIIKQAKHRAGDAFRQSHFLDQAKKNLLERGEPCSGRVLEEEISRVRRRFVEVQLSQLGQERAQFWGWPNTYTYTKSIGEQIIARSGLPFTIVRPAIIESCIEYPCKGWNEGVNTSAPIIYAIREGQQQLPGDTVRLDLIPCDLVASGMLLSLAELLEGTAKPVYQYGTSDSNPVTMSRVFELSGLHKRRYFQRTGRGGPIASFLQAHLEGALLKPKSFEQYGPQRVARGVRAVADLLSQAPDGALSLSLEPAAASLRKFARQQENIARVVGQFVPFTAELDYEFRCDNTRAAFARTTPEERALLYWEPEAIDWRDWFLNTHIPGLDRWVFPELEAKLRKTVKALRSHETVVHLLTEMAERHNLAVALQAITPDGLSRVSYSDLHARAITCATQLSTLGVAAGTRVALIATNQVECVIALFGIMYASGVAVIVDPLASLDQQKAAVESTGCVVGFVSDPSTHGAISDGTHKWLIQHFGSDRLLPLPTREPRTPLVVSDLPRPTPDQDAVTVFSRGTTGVPSSTTFTHKNLVSLLGSLGPLFPLSAKDRLLSVQPLSLLPELVVGLLLPLSRGARVVYPSATDLKTVLAALSSGHITALVGNAPFWHKLLATLMTHVNVRGVGRKLLTASLDLSLKLKTSAGIDAGPLLLAPLHALLGGRLRLLVNTGGSLTTRTGRQFMALGLPLADVYCLTECGPLSVAPPGARKGAGQVGYAVPGVTLSIHEPDATGAGEVVARGPSVPRPLVEDERHPGWSGTGDLGRLDERGRLTLLGRACDAIKASDGTWVHANVVESALGKLQEAAELAVFTNDARELTVVVAPDRTLPPSDVAAWERHMTSRVDVRLAHLPPAHRPTSVFAHNGALPRKPDGEVDRQALAVLVSKQKEQPAHAVEVRDSRGSKGSPSGSGLKPLRFMANRLVRRANREKTQTSN
jgi:long-chain acyl-CoA synthetase